MVAEWLSEHPSRWRAVLHPRLHLPRAEQYVLPAGRHVLEGLLAVRVQHGVPPVLAGNQAAGGDRVCSGGAQLGLQVQHRARAGFPLQPRYLRLIGECILQSILHEE